MERDLNIKKLVKMYILNLWIVVLAGIVVAAGLNMMVKGTDENVISKSVYLVYELEGTEHQNLEAKKNTYFDAYKGLLNGNVLKKSDSFTDYEKSRLSNTSMSAESSCYTIILTVPNDGKLEADQELFDKYILESEKWMKEKFNDKSLRIEMVSNNVSVGTGQKGTMMTLAVGFIVGAILAAVFLFVYFVMDRKIRTEEDVVYYTGVECIGTVKRRK